MKSDPSSSMPAPIIQEEMLAIRHQHLFYHRLTPSHAGWEAKPPLVFLHEALGCAAMWHDFPARTVNDTGHGAIVYDRLGYGRSESNPRTRDTHYLHVEAEDMLPLVLDGLQIQRAILVGHSDGGSIALLAAAAIPDRIAGIVTLAAHVFVEPITLSGIRSTVAAFGPRQLEQRLARYHGDNTRTLFFAWAETWLSDGFRSWNIEACLGKIQCPALVIQGREDPYGSDRQVHAIVDGIGAHATPLLIDGCGHAPHRDASDGVREAIAHFVRHLPEVDNKRPPIRAKHGGSLG